jgi:hypothetical protein
MTTFLKLSLVVASLATVVGCGASSHATHITTTPNNALVAERDESSWTPPEEMALAIRESATSEGNEKTHAKSSYRPNRQDRPVRGAIHAATY